MDKVGVLVSGSIAECAIPELHQAGHRIRRTVLALVFSDPYPIQIEQIFVSGSGDRQPTWLHFWIPNLENSLSTPPARRGH
jgi:hypothetical protein